LWSCQQDEENDEREKPISSKYQAQENRNDRHLDHHPADCYPLPAHQPFPARCEFRASVKKPSLEDRRYDRQSIPETAIMLEAVVQSSGIARRYLPVVAIAV
jgi:hypothetical protein